MASMMSLLSDATARRESEKRGKEASGGPLSARFSTRGSSVLNTVSDWVAPMSSRPEAPLVLGGSSARSYRTMHSSRGLNSSSRRNLQDGQQFSQALLVAQTETLNVPGTAYGSACPMEACGIPARKLPCGGKQWVQALCGNTADIATGLAGSSLDGDEAGSLDFPSLEQAGWVRSDTAKVLQTMTDPEELVHMSMGMETLGLEPVAHAALPTDGMMLSFPKNSIPAKPKEVKHLVKTLSRQPHPSAVTFLEACEDEETVYFVYENPGGIGLLPLLLARKDDELQKMATRVFAQLVAPIAHYDRFHLNLLDWSIWNVMSTSYASINPAKLFGIGLAGVMYSKNLPGGQPYASPFRGAYNNGSPELATLRDGGHADVFVRLDSQDRSPSDIWGLGTIIFTMLTCRPPFAGKDEEEVRKKMISGTLNINPKNDFPDLHPDGILLIEKCLQKRSKLRPTPEQLLSHHWVVQQVGKVDAKLMNEIIDMLTLFTKHGDVLRAVALISREVLVPEMEQYLEEVYRSIDLRGDGQVGLEELVNMVGHGREVIRAIMRSLGRADTISRADFFAATYFTKTFLTKRMIKHVFHVIDKNESGSVTAKETFLVLRSLEPELTPEDVASFFGSRHFGWDSILTFENFAKLFPDAKDHGVEVRRRRKRCEGMLALLSQASLDLRTEAEEWLTQMMQTCECLLVLQERNRKKEGGTPKITGRVLQHLRNLTRAVTHRVPEVKIPSFGAKTFSQKAVQSALERRDGFETRAKFKPEEADHWPKDIHGFFALDLCVAMKRKTTYTSWVETCLGRASQVDAMEYKDERRVAIEDIINTAVDRVRAIARLVRADLEEQAWALEACGNLECTCPPRPWSRCSLGLGRPACEAVDLLEEYSKKAKIRISDEEPKAAVDVADPEAMRAMRGRRRSLATLQSALDTLAPAMWAAADRIRGTQSLRTFSGR